MDETRTRPRGKKGRRSPARARVAEPHAGARSERRLSAPPPGTSPSAPASGATVPDPYVIPVGVAGALAVAMLNHLTGGEVAFTLFFALPVLWVTSRLGTRAGVGLALLAGAASFLSTQLAPAGSRAPALAAVNSGLRASLLVLLAVLLGHLRRRLLEELAESRQRQGVLASVLRAIGDGVVVADRGGRFVEFNPAAERILGMGARDVGIADWPRTYGVYDADGTRALAADEVPLARALRGESTDGVELVVKNARLPHGTHIAATGRPILDERGSITGGVVVFRDVTERRAREDAVQHANRLLERSVRALERRNRELAQIGELSELLGAARTRDEACALLAQHAPALLPGWRGGLFAFRASRDHLELVACWEGTEQPPLLAPEGCWGLRRGRMHTSRPMGTDPRCEHAGSASHPTICLPLLAHGDTVGLLHLELVGERDDEEVATRRAVLTALGEHAALSISNMNLRESLRHQAIRDPLTGLFNRRYMEEWLPKEIARASRYRRPLSAVMLDLDHFKHLNDAHGHAAGDVVLRALGGMLKRTLRGGDIACRYGGEEFLLLLPEAPLEGARLRAEELRGEVSRLEIRLQGMLLGPLTASWGVATYPDHADDGATLLLRADAALYRAKREGRNRVCVAAAAPEPAGAPSRAPGA